CPLCPLLLRRPPRRTRFPYTTLFRSLMQESFTPLHARDVGGIIQLGGTMLGSARAPEFATDSGRRAALHNLAKRGIDGLVVIGRSEEHTSELQSRENLVCRLLLEKKK